MKKLNVWIQCRVFNENSKNLLRYQADVLTDMANELGMNIIGVNKEISNGKKLTSYGSKQMLNYIRRHKVDVILVYSKKRVAIFEDLYEEFQMLCEKYNVQILTKDDLMKGYLIQQMAYNKANEKKLFNQWKNQEVELLRQFNIDEKVITQLQHLDWKSFNQKRQFLEMQYTNYVYVHYFNESEDILPIDDIDHIIEHINKEQMIEVFNSLDENTLKMIYLKLFGYSYQGMSRIMNVNESSIKQKINHVRKNFINRMKAFSDNK